MSDLKNNTNLSDFVEFFMPSEINIKKEDIFYREKYQEIINFIKINLTDSKDLELFQYVEPKGTILINVACGSDLIDYLQLVCSNFYIFCAKLNENEIIVEPDYFFDNFNEILMNLDKIFRESGKFGQNTDNQTQEINPDNLTKLFIIDYNERLKEILEKRNLLNKFITKFKNKKNQESLEKNNSILVWINYEYDELIKYSEELFEIFDLMVRVPILDSFEREQIFTNFLEYNPKISFDIHQLINLTENWEVKDIKRLLNLGILKHHLKSELNTKSNEITEILINLIESGEFIPSYKASNHEMMTTNQEQKRTSTKNAKATRERIIREQPNLEKVIEEIKTKKYSDFILDQLYENAVDHNYNELVIVIDKLEKNEPLESNDRRLLSEYPFILTEEPSKAQIKLEKAKKKVDLIKKSFGK